MFLEFECCDIVVRIVAVREEIFPKGGHISWCPRKISKHFDVHGFVHRKPICKYNQQNATLHSLFISVKCSTCFRRFLRPSSGAQNCIYSIGYFVKPLLLPATVMDDLELWSSNSSNSSKFFRRFLRPSSGAQNCIYCTGYFVKPLLLPATVLAGSSKGFTKYPMQYIQFWAPDDGRRNSLKHVGHLKKKKSVTLHLVG